MSDKYKELDRAILRLIESKSSVEFYWLEKDQDVSHQADLIAHRENRRSFRIIDGRLQSMRRRKLIRHNGRGWVMKEST